MPSGVQPQCARNCREAEQGGRDLSWACRLECPDHGPPAQRRSPHCTGRSSFVLLALPKSVRPAPKGFMNGPMYIGRPFLPVGAT